MSYLIMAKSRYGTEEIDEAEDLKTAEYLTREYQMAYGAEWSVSYTPQKGGGDT